MIVFKYLDFPPLPNKRGIYTYGIWTSSLKGEVDSRSL